MFGRIALLAWPGMADAFGLNEARFARDAAKKRRAVGLLIVYAFVAVMVMGYIGGIAYLFTQCGMTDVIPAYAASMAGLLVLVATVLRAGAVLFDAAGYEKQACLPVMPWEIALSRFLSLYLRGLVFSLAVFLPALGVYVWAAAPGVWFYAAAVVCLVLSPLLPVAVSSALGAAIAAASGRMRHKNIFTIAAYMLVTFVALGVSAYVAAQGGSDMEALTAIVSSAGRAITSAYPPAKLAGGAMTGSFGRLAVFAAVSIVPNALVVIFVARGYAGIVARLSASVRHGAKSGYAPTVRRPGAALYRKEMSVYFSSGIYVMNTAIGYLLMTLAAAALLITGKARIDEMTGMGGLIDTLLPFALSLMCVMSPSTSSAISIEGRRWWITGSLPLPARRVYTAKILVMLTVALPFYLISEVLMFAAVRPGLIEGLYLALMPAAYLVFGAVCGLLINSRMPVFNWESEMTVVKQSAAVGVTMVVCMASVIVPACLAVLLPDAAGMVMAQTLSLVIVMTAALCAVLFRKKISAIG